VDLASQDGLEVTVHEGGGLLEFLALLLAQAGKGQAGHGRPSSGGEGQLLHGMADPVGETPVGVLELLVVTECRLQAIPARRKPGLLCCQFKN